MRPSEQDAIGIASVTAVNTAALLGLTWIGDHASKEVPVGPTAYVLPTIVGACIGLLFGVAAYVVGRKKENRTAHYVGFGWLAMIFLVPTYCGWWGEWCYQFGRFLLY
jgi:hypothetical protein